LSQPHFELLEKSVKLGSSQYQSLHYNTNGTLFPERAAKEIWPHFKSVNVMLSIDGLGNEFEYQRFPAQWKKVEENIDRFKALSYLDVDICFTVNVMNVWSFPEFYRWSKKKKLGVWINYLYDPYLYRAQNFSSKAKEQIIDKLKAPDLMKESKYRGQIEPLIRYLKDRSFNDDQRRQLIEHISLYDGYRKQKFVVVFPEVYHLLQINDDKLESVPPVP
jgi:hypothetical protein